MGSTAESWVHHQSAAFEPWTLSPIDRFALRWLIQGTWVFDADDPWWHALRRYSGTQER